MSEQRAVGRQRSATAQVRERTRDRVDTSSRDNTKRITLEIVEWLKEDEDLLDTFLYEQAFHTVAEVVRAVMAESRRVKRYRDLLEEPEEFRRQRLQEWLDQREHVNPKVGYVRLGAMTRPDLKLAREDREARVTRDATRLRWYALLEAGMPDDEQTVEQVYTALQVEQAYESASEAVLAHLSRLTEGAADALRSILRPGDEPGQNNHNRRRAANGPAK